MTAIQEPGPTAAHQPTPPQPRPQPTPMPPAPWPLVTVSGLYASRRPMPLGSTPRSADMDGHAPIDGDGAAEVDPLDELSLPGPPWRPRRRVVAEQLRLDVDGRYPQMVASGTVRQWLAGRLHWVATLHKTGASSWAGTIIFKDGDHNILPHTRVRIHTTGSPFPEQRQAKVTFAGAGAPLQRTYRFVSPHFHEVELEFDRVAGTTPTTEVDTGAHPNRPASLPAEPLSIEEVFTRAGFAVRKSGGDSVIPLAGGGVDGRWNDQEMHDAMQVYWSRFADAPQWSMWVLWAGQYQSGPNMGGIMFDDMGPNHRQGTAVFIDSFISNAPAGEADPGPWVERMRFWTAVHEMGHAFNLAHSWQKSLGSPWIPLANEPEARSFMNYPYNVSGGQTAFFADFAYRFSDAELLFMRHAPERFVQMGNADWFDDHGFEDAEVSPEPALSLELRVNRTRPEFEFLEPVMVEVKLKNVSGRPLVVDDASLSSMDDFTIVIKRERDPARLFRPFARYCLERQASVLAPGEALYESLFLSAGTGGWDISEPGRYRVQAALHLDGQDVVSAPLALRVHPPRGYEEEDLAQEFFSETVGRVLAFQGTRVLTTGNAVLADVAERLPERRVARHAHYALGAPLATPTKLLRVDGRPGPRTASGAGGQITAAPPQPEEAAEQLTSALAEDMATAAETFGHIAYKRRVDRFSDVLAGYGDTERAARLLERLEETLAARGVLPRVLQDISRRRQHLRSSGS